MDHTSVEIAIAIGFAFAVYLGTNIVANQMWKPPYLLGALTAVLVSAVLGIIFEKTGVFPEKQGMAFAVLMFAPLIHFVYFQVFRFLFKKWKGTEPFVSVRSGLRIGDPPTPLLASENVYRERRKFDETRRLMWADRFFGILQAIVPVITIFVLLLTALIYDR